MMPAHLLIAEDNRPNRILIETYVRKFGFRSTSVVNGLEAVEAVKTAEFDLVLMDIQMPKLDGLAATRQIRSLPSDKCNIPILALTAIELNDAQAACLAAGTNGIVCKPIDPADLLTQIYQHIEPPGE